MKVFYNIEIQMREDGRVDDRLLENAASAFRFGKTDIDELESYRLTAIFHNDIAPSAMRERTGNFLRLCAMPDNNNPVHYVDVMYRFEHENVPDRFVFWGDGRKQEYTGHIVFKEDGADE